MTPTKAIWNLYDMLKIKADLFYCGLVPLTKHLQFGGCPTAYKEFQERL
jgi:hypothetical protein